MPSDETLLTLVPLVNILACLLPKLPLPCFSLLAWTIYLPPVVLIIYVYPAQFGQVPVLVSTVLPVNCSCMGLMQAWERSGWTEGCSLSTWRFANNKQINQAWVGLFKDKSCKQILWMEDSLLAGNLSCWSPVFSRKQADDYHKGYLPSTYSSQYKVLKHDTIKLCSVYFIRYLHTSLPPCHASLFRVSSCYFSLPRPDEPQPIQRLVLGALSSARKWRFKGYRSCGDTGRSCHQAVGGGGGGGG